MFVLNIRQGKQLPEKYETNYYGCITEIGNKKYKTEIVKADTLEWNSEIIIPIKKVQKSLCKINCINYSGKSSMFANNYLIGTVEINWGDTYRRIMLTPQIIGLH